MAKILITGGAGYLGSVLVPRLIERGHRINVIDLCWFGDTLSPRLGLNRQFRLFPGDIRDTDLLRSAMAGCDTVIHLACIANTPGSDLDKDLTMSINLKAYTPLLEMASELGIHKFINASSAGVYGAKNGRRVTEDFQLEPMTLYARCKAGSEQLVRSFETDAFRTISVRSAMFCGYSPRQRLDLTANILTNFAVNKGKIVVQGGSGQCPHIHLQDMVAFYSHLVEMDPEPWGGLAYNVGSEHFSEIEIAEIVRKVVGKDHVEIEVTETNNCSSYEIDSSLAKERLGFRPGHSLEEAIMDMKMAFEDNLLPDSFANNNYFNVKAMKAIGIG